MDENPCSFNSEGRNEDYIVTFYTQLVQVMKRSVKILIRKPMLLMAHITVSILIGLFIGAVYFKSDQSLGGVQNRLGSLYYTLVWIAFSSISAIGAFTEERFLFMRERSNGFYGPIPFFFSKVLFDLFPLRLIPTAIMTAISYWLISYSTDLTSFLKYYVVVLVFAAECGLLCLAIGAAFDDVGTANLVAVISILLQMLMAGLLINQNMIPTPLRWVQYLSAFKYSYEALAVNDISSIQITDSISGVKVSLPAAIVLDKFGFALDGYYRNLFISIGLTGLFWITIALLFMFKLKEKR